VLLLLPQSMLHDLMLLLPKSMLHCWLLLLISNTLPGGILLGQMQPLRPDCWTLSGLRPGPAHILGRWPQASTAARAGPSQAQTKHHAWRPNHSLPPHGVVHKWQRCSRWWLGASGSSSLAIACSDSWTCVLPAALLQNLHPQLLCVSPPAFLLKA